jgi:hypothetical protein
MKTRAEWELVFLTSANSFGLPLSTSGVAEWKLWRDTMITIVMVFEKIVNIFQKDIDLKLLSKQHGGLYWYGEIAKEWQSGDSLTVDYGIVKYNPVNASHRVIAQVSVKEVNDDVLVMKVAKKVGSNLVALGSTELTNFKSYIKARKLPGTKINVYSLAAHNVFIDGPIYYDALYDPSLVEANILAALESFKTGFSFDGVLYRSGIIDAIMNAQGVVGTGDVSIEVNLTGAYVQLATYFELPSGYFNYDTPSLALLPAI